MQATSILILTQDAALRQRWEGLAALGWQLEHGSNLQAMNQLPGLTPWLAIVDAQWSALPDWSDAVWRQKMHAVRALVVSAHMSDEEGQRILAQGAWGYAHTHSSLVSLHGILSSIAAGSIWMGRSLLQRLLQDIDDRLPINPDLTWQNNLSQREIEVAELAAMGKSNAEIAVALQITERTVKAHLSSVFLKLDINDRLKLALKVHGVRA